MAVILAVVYSKGLRGYGGIVIGGMVGLDIFFLGFISGASMNPARSLAPARFRAFRLTYGFTGLPLLLELLSLHLSIGLSLSVGRKMFLHLVINISL
jgi:major intrinsic protein